MAVCCSTLFFCVTLMNMVKCSMPMTFTLSRTSLFEINLVNKMLRCLDFMERYIYNGVHRKKTHDHETQTQSA